MKVKRGYIFINRERGREKEKEKKILRNRDK